MGKRELLIIVVFAAIGVVAYEMTAAPAKSGQGFSFSKLWQNAKREIRSNSASAQFVHSGSLPAAAALEQVRVGDINRGVKIIGEDRKDITYELTVDSNGPDQATALDYAKRSVLKVDDLGQSLALRVTYPQEGSQSGSLLLRVPARLTVRIDGRTNGVSAKGVAALELVDRVSGLTTAENIAGAVTGMYRNGELTVAGAGSVNLTIGSGTRARFLKIKGKLTLNARDGRCEIAESSGPLEIDESNEELTITGHAGTIRVSGTGGRVTINDPTQETKIDVRRAEIDVRLRAAVPLTVLSSDQTLHLWLDGPPAIMLDAVASDGGQVQASELGLTATTAEQEQRLSQPLGGAAGPRVVLRNLRANIVIGKAK